MLNTTDIFVVTFMDVPCTAYVRLSCPQYAQEMDGALVHIHLNFMSYPSKVDLIRVATMVQDRIPGLLKVILDGKFNILRRCAFILPIEQNAETPSLTPVV